MKNKQELRECVPRNPSKVLSGLWILRASCRPHTTLCPPGDCLPQKTNPTLKHGNHNWHINNNEQKCVCRLADQPDPY